MDPDIGQPADTGNQLPHMFLFIDQLAFIREVLPFATATVIEMIARGRDPFCSRLQNFQ